MDGFYFMNNVTVIDMNDVTDDGPAMDNEEDSSSSNGIVAGIFRALKLLFFAIGLGFVVVIGLLLIAESGNESQPGVSGDKVASNNPVHDSLRFQALQQVKDYSTGLSGMCDNLSNVSLKNITYGTANSGRGSSTRFPAIIANYDGICVQSITGDRTSLDMFWVILAVDDLGNKLRCLKIAGKPVIDNVASSCAFKPEP